MPSVSPARRREARHSCPAAGDNLLGIRGRLFSPGSGLARDLGVRSSSETSPLSLSLLPLAEPARLQSEDHPGLGLRDQSFLDEAVFWPIDVNIEADREVVVVVDADASLCNE